MTGIYKAKEKLLILLLQERLGLGNTTMNFLSSLMLSSFYSAVKLSRPSQLMSFLLSQIAIQ